MTRHLNAPSARRRLKTAPAPASTTAPRTDRRPTTDRDRGRTSQAPTRTASPSSTRARPTPARTPRAGKRTRPLPPPPRRSQHTPRRPITDPPRALDLRQSERLHRGATRSPQRTTTRRAGRGCCFSAREQSWRTGSSVRSLLRWTTTSSHDTAPGAIATRECASWCRIARAIACASMRSSAGGPLGSCAALLLIVRLQRAGAPSGAPGLLPCQEQASAALLFSSSPAGATDARIYTPARPALRERRSDSCVVDVVATASRSGGTTTPAGFTVPSSASRSAGGACWRLTAITPLVLGARPIRRRILRGRPASG